MLRNVLIVCTSKQVRSYTLMVCTWKHARWDVISGVPFFFFFQALPGSDASKLLDPGRDTQRSDFHLLYHTCMTDRHWRSLKSFLGHYGTTLGSWKGTRKLLWFSILKPASSEHGPEVWKSFEIPRLVPKCIRVCFLQCNVLPSLKRT